MQIINDDKTHTFTLWGFAYRGSKCYSCRDSQEEKNHLLRDLIFEPGEEKVVEIPVLLDSKMEEGEYNLKISKKAKQMRLEIHRNGELVVTVPRGMDYGFVERFVYQKSNWIADKLRYFNSLKENPVVEPSSLQGQRVFLNTSRREYLKYKSAAKILAENRITYYNKFYNFRINRVAIKNTKSRWGSCSKRGNLNFSYKIALLPKDLADYVIVHELCHLGEFNHSKGFWKLVSLTIPNYIELKNKFHK